MSQSLVSERALARTYDGGAYTDPWDAVEDYRRVLEYTSRHPDEGSTAVSSALELPRGRIRPWMDGSAPDSVRGIETAREYGWIDATYGDPEFTALNSLVANVFSGGSIAERNYSPSFTLNHRGEVSHVVDALELAGVDYRIVDDREDRADEARPTTDGTVLGRVLAVLGAPVGPKGQQRLSLPAYLDDAPHETKEMFVYCYLENRAVEYEEKATLRVAEDRNKSYLLELAALIHEVSDGRVAVDDHGITISAEAARNLGTVR